VHGRIVFVDQDGDALAVVLVEGAGKPLEGIGKFTVGDLVREYTLELPCSGRVEFLLIKQLAMLVVYLADLLPNPEHGVSKRLRLDILERHEKNRMFLKMRHRFGATRDL